MGKSDPPISIQAGGKYYHRTAVNQLGHPITSHAYLVIIWFWYYWLLGITHDFAPCLSLSLENFIAPCDTFQIVAFLP